MKLKLYESKWDNKIKGDLATTFYNNIESANLEGVKESSIDILNKCRDFFEEEKDEYILNDIDVLINSFEEAETEEDIDDVLNDLYDFCDDYLILIDVSEEPEDAEVFIDSSKDTGTKEKEDTEIEPIEVVELDPKSDEE